GFHGINHQYCAERSARLLERDLGGLKLITCHLGNGCSLAAISGGRSIDTTMGFTPLEGLMMGHAFGFRRSRHSHVLDEGRKAGWQGSRSNLERPIENSWLLRNFL